MFTISVETQFLASHQLIMADGSKEPVHRHKWLVSADVSSGKLDAAGVVIDFRALKSALDSIVAEFDNVMLNNIDYFGRNGPSAENVARYIYEKLAPRLPKAVKLAGITVAEEPGCSARFVSDS